MSRTTEGCVRISLAAATLILALNAWGCAVNRYQAPVSTFHDKTVQTVGVLSDFYSTRNAYEVDLYLQSVAANSDLEVLEIDSNGNPTPLGRPTFKPASIKARMDALNLVGIYANRLYELANTQAPTNFQSASTALGENLSELDKTFGKLQGASDPTASKYIGPISNIIGIVGQMYLEHERDQMIKKAVNEGSPAVDTVLSTIRDDMDRVFSQEVVSGAKERLAVLVNSYNQQRHTLNYEQRNAQISAIKAAATEASASVGSAPASLVTSMMDAHKALVAAVNSSKSDKPASLAAFNTALSAWTIQIQALATQIRLLIH